MENLWTLFCGVGAYDGKKMCVFNWENLTDPSSCSNHGLVISVDILFLVMLILNLAYKRCSISRRVHAHIEHTSSLKTCSTILNVALGLAFTSVGIWNFEESLRITNTIFPLHRWLVELFQGFAGLALCLTMTVGRGCDGNSFVRVLSILMFLYTGFMCGTSIYEAILEKVITVKCVLDVLSLPGAMFLVCQINTQKYQCSNQDASSHTTLFLHLNHESNDEYKIESSTSVTPLSQAGFLSKMFFWWLNPLMKKGKEKILDDEDIPQLREVDKAESCYTTFLEQLNKQKQINSATSPSLLRVIIFCQWKEILLTGFFALIKILTLSATPLLLNAFIEISDGKQDFKNEGFVLALALFLAKCLECLSQRQWFFRSRVIGLQVRSLLSAAIYRKQQRLSNIGKMVHSSGEIINYVSVDAYRIGEFPYWLHQTWTTILQICIALAILVRAVGLATVASLIVIILTVICNTPLAKLQLGFQSKLMVAQGERLKATTEALMSMKVLKLYAWETHFKNSIESLRKEEYKWLSAVQLQTAYNAFLFWASPVLVSTTTLVTCYFLGVTLRANNVFTFLATIRMLQEPIRTIPDVVGVTIQAKIALSRIERFLQAPELQKGNVRQKNKPKMEVKHSILMESVNLSWEENQSIPTLRKINMKIKPGEKVAICGEVGSGKSTLLTAILGEVPFIKGTLQANGKIAYVSQTAWIQAGSIRENILFGSNMDKLRYQATLEMCSLVKDLAILPYGDLTEIGERGINLSGGQKHRVQLARALYQDADVYLLDDPFSAIDVLTATSLFSECIMEALAGKTVLLVTNQVDFLPAFDCILLMSDGEVLHAANYHQLMESSQQFRALVKAHNETTGSDMILEMHSSCRGTPPKEIKSAYNDKKFMKSSGEQLIKQEERETGASGLKPYKQYLNQNKGFLYFSLTSLSHLAFAVGLIIQNSWMAANIDNPDVSKLKLIVVYFVIGCISISFLLLRSLFVTAMGILSSKSLFIQLMNSLFRAPTSFYEATPLGRILSRVSSDLSIIDLDIPIKLMFTIGSTINTLANLSVVIVVTWQVLIITIPMVYVVIRLQDYYFACAKEMMRINGTTKSKIANHMTESLAGAVTIRAFEEEDRFFAKNLELIDANASPNFHNFSANEWLIQRLELIGAAVLTTSVLAMALLPQGSFGPGFVGMALSYGLPLNVVLSYCIQAHCVLANHIVSVERIHQYTHIPSEAPEVIEENQPFTSWPAVGRIDIYDLKVRYRPDTPLVLRGISCTFDGGSKIGIVGRTGSGKTTLISALFRIVEPSSGQVILDGIDISTIGLHDLRSRLGIIPQDPTLFNGTVRYNLDPLSQYSDQEIFEVLGKCKLWEVIQAKEEGLDSLVSEDGSNWSMGQRQMFCLGRVLLRKCRIFVLDEATASIDNATDLILQKTIRTEFADCTVITVAHRIPTVMDCTRVLSISDGKLVEYDEPLKLIKREDSLFGQLVKEYCSQSHFAAPTELH